MAMAPTYAVPETLAESHFFGHESGAFTGADKEKKARSREHTLFLDEIQALPLEIQTVDRKVTTSREHSYTIRLSKV